MSFLKIHFTKSKCKSFPTFDTFCVSWVFFDVVLLSNFNSVSQNLWKWKKIYIPGSHPANSIELQALILLSQCNPIAHGWTIYLSWLQTRNELQSDGFGAKPPKAEQAWPRKTNKILNYNISQFFNITSFGCKMWKKILRNIQHFFSVYMQNF